MMKYFSTIGCLPAVVYGLTCFSSRKPPQPTVEELDDTASLKDVAMALETEIPSYNMLFSPKIRKSDIVENMDFEGKPLPPPSNDDKKRIFISQVLAFMKMVKEIEDEKMKRMSNPGAGKLFVEMKHTPGGQRLANKFRTDIWNPNSVFVDTLTNELKDVSQLMPRLRDCNDDGVLDPEEKKIGCVLM